MFKYYLHNQYLRYNYCILTLIFYLMLYIMLLSLYHLNYLNIIYLK